MTRDIVVYSLTFPSGKQYVGQTNNLKRRWHDHATNSKSQCARVVSSIKKYGWHSVVCDVLHIGMTREEASVVESAYISSMNTLHPNGLNLTSRTDAKGMSTETKAKLSKAHKGRKFSEEQKSRMRGRKLSAEHVAKIREAHKRRDPKTYRTGPRKSPMSDAHRDKLRAPYSADRLARFHTAMKRRVITEDQLRKAGAASAARIRTPEENTKRSSTVAALQAERRAVGYIRPDTPARTNSGYRNVTWLDRTGSYVVNICVNKKTHHVGYFKDVAMAINARDKFRAEHGLSTVKDGGAKCQ